MIKIKVRYLGAIRELAGVLEEEISLENNITLNQLLEYLLKIHTNLNQTINAFTIAINGRIVTNFSQSLKDRDEVILSHIIAGGM